MLILNASGHLVKRLKLTNATECPIKRAFACFRYQFATVAGKATPAANQGAKSANLPPWHQRERMIQSCKLSPLRSDSYYKNSVFYYKIGAFYYKNYKLYYTYFIYYYIII